MIAKKAATGELMDRAKKQGLALLELITFMAEGAGWTVVIETKPPVKVPQEHR
jgi:hypothetical protein